MDRIGTEAEHGVVLIAADDPARARMMMDCLSRAGHDVIFSSDAVDAERSALRRNPDLAIVDLHRVSAEGRELADRIHSHRRLRRMPIVRPAGGRLDAIALGARVGSIVRAS